MLTITAIPAFSDNYIWCLTDAQTQKALVVDPGQAEPVMNYLEANNLTLDTILITHHHPDHVGGVKILQGQWPGCRVVGPADSPFKGATEAVQAGDSITWGDLFFKVHGVPGHTLDHIAYFCNEKVNGRPVLFCGDTLFVSGCGRLFEGTPSQMRHSLDTLRSLPEQTAVYCAHEYTLANLKFARDFLPDDSSLAAFEQECVAEREAGKATVPSSIGVERKLNPFLRWDDPMVIEAAKRYSLQAGLPSETDDDIFAAIRHGKDNF